LSRSSTTPWSGTAAHSQLPLRGQRQCSAQQFDAQAAPLNTNYWGHQPVAWFAPHRACGSSPEPLGPVNGFRDLVKALHRAGVEVVLDVVFNYTAEGTENGPMRSLRGLDNPTHSLLEPGNPAAYIDDTGCGHTISGNETVIRRIILDCLRYWMEHLHVDGFRFDLASALSQRHGHLAWHSPEPAGLGRGLPLAGL
jgi:glycogen operon protein